MEVDSYIFLGSMQVPLRWALKHLRSCHRGVEKELGLGMQVHSQHGQPHRHIPVIGILGWRRKKKERSCPVVMLPLCHQQPQDVLQGKDSIVGYHYIGGFYLQQAQRKEEMQVQCIRRRRRQT